MKWLRWLWDRFLGWWCGPPLPALPVARTSARVEELPEVLDPARVYVVREGEHAWSVAFVCPCACGATLNMNLLPGPYPCWSVVEHEDGTVSLSPSVNRTTGCRSHFFLRRGLVEWCYGSNVGANPCAFTSPDYEVDETAADDAFADDGDACPMPPDER